jgi:Leucine-rich repeat (LRR) protein
MNTLYVAGAVIIVCIVVLLSLMQSGTVRPGAKVDVSTTATKTAVVTVGEPSQVTTTPQVSQVALDLSNQRLTKTPSSLFSQTDLEELNLSGNELTGALPAEVRQLTLLRVLNLSRNAFTGVPAEIGQLKQLEILDLSYNDLTGLPHELGNLTRLKTLNLKGTNYSTEDLAIIKKTLPATTEILTD